MSNSEGRGRRAHRIDQNEQETSNDEHHVIIPDPNPEIAETENVVVTDLEAADTEVAGPSVDDMRFAIREVNSSTDSTERSEESTPISYSSSFERLVNESDEPAVESAQTFTSRSANPSEIAGPSQVVTPPKTRGRVRAWDKPLDEAQLDKFRRDFRIPDDHKLILPGPSQTFSDPPEGCIALSGAHLEAGLRIPFANYFANIVNMVEMAPFQLTPNSYKLLASLYLLIHGISHRPPFKEVVRYYLWSKRTNRDNVHYLCFRAGTHGHLVIDLKSNAGNYKKQFFFVKGPSIRSFDHRSFVPKPCKCHFNFTVNSLLYSYI